MRTITFNVLIFVFLIGFLEGAASLTEIIFNLAQISQSGESFGDDDLGISEAKHARYNPELGWVNIPSLYVKNIYGPGTYLETNEQGFRNKESITPEKPTGKVRIVCSGDSFTLGYGVGNTDAWCNHLSELRDDIQAVNMGQGGYGAGQAYLWYKKDGASLDHDVHLFSIIRHDLNRMLESTFEGYEKPLLKLERDQILVENVPVPDNLRKRKRLLIKREILETLALAKMAEKVQEKLARNAVGTESENLPSESPPSSELEDAFPLINAILSDLADVNAQKSSRLVFVLLPNWEDWRGGKKHDAVRERLRQICARQGINFIDLTDAFRQQDYLTAATFFQFGTKGGHYSVQGNRFVAEHILDRLGAWGIYGPEAGSKSAQGPR